MGTLAWLRAARRVVGLSNQPEYPSLEALLEAEAGQPHNGFFYAARIVPPIGVVVGTAVFLPLALTISPLFFIGTAGLSVLGIGLGILFHFLDRAISPSRKRIRRIAGELWTRYGLGSLVGMEPVLSDNVGRILDEAASIYQRYFPTAGPRPKISNDAFGRALQALEVAMARMLELATIKSAQAQELELDSGWALPLLQEMRQMDATLAQVTKYSVNGLLPVDVRANLAEARAELTGIVSAMEELEQQN